MVAAGLTPPSSESEAESGRGLLDAPAPRPARGWRASGRGLARPLGACAAACTAAVAVAAVAQRRRQHGAVARRVLPAGARRVGLDEAGPSEFGFDTSVAVKTFQWTQPVRTLEEAIDGAYGDRGWQQVEFTEGLPGPITKGALVDWVTSELLGGPGAFAGHGGRVPVPWPDPEPGQKYIEDQLPPGHWVAYSRRQVCAIAAQALMGATTEGYANGLSRYLDVNATNDGGCLPRNGDFGRALVALLAACAADPALSAGGQGPLLVVAKARHKPNASTVRGESGNATLASAGLRVCQYGDGAEPVAGVAAVPQEACSQPTGAGPGRDFMTGGLNGQGVVDISAAWLGGYIWGNTCGLGGGQDERLMVYMPEVFALSFFLSEAPGTNPEERNTPQLRQPAWILGARRVFKGLDGTARFNNASTSSDIDADVPMTSDLVAVELPSGVDGRLFNISTSAPFVAFMSENQDYELQDNGTSDRGQDTQAARHNALSGQRRVDASCDHAFEKQVRAWYGSTALSSYSAGVRSVLRKVVKSLGTGPWLSGLWWGDSQLGLLAMWIGHAIAARTWPAAGSGDAPLPLDYYLYSSFTENPGNQCYVLRGGDCRACLRACRSPPPPEWSFWMPGFAAEGAPANASWDPPAPQDACVTETASCPSHGLQDVVAAYAGSTAEQLWSDVEAALGRSSGNASEAVFDLLLSARA